MKEKQFLPNFALARSAVAAMERPDSPRAAGNSWKFIWSILRVNYGERVAFPSLGYNPDAVGRFYELAGYSLPVESELLPGDLLFQSGDLIGGVGHVGLYYGDNYVMENCSYHCEWPDMDARGMRTLDRFGRFDRLIRLPL